jgi:hypothetical protein
MYYSTLGEHLYLLHFFTDSRSMCGGGKEQDGTLSTEHPNYIMVTVYLVEDWNEKASISFIPLNRIVLTLNT